jgi:hypothetical protein
MQYRNSNFVLEISFILKFSNQKYFSVNGSFVAGAVRSKGFNFSGQGKMEKWKGKHIKTCRNIWKRGN